MTIQRACKRVAAFLFPAEKSESGKEKLNIAFHRQGTARVSAIKTSE
jgi:hypothetical protein